MGRGRIDVCFINPSAGIRKTWANGIGKRKGRERLCSHRDPSIRRHGKGDACVSR
jgi:hypothetical protein